MKLFVNEILKLVGVYIFILIKRYFFFLELIEEIKERRYIV